MNIFFSAFSLELFFEKFSYSVIMLNYTVRQERLSVILHNEPPIDENSGEQNVLLVEFAILDFIDFRNIEYLLLHYRYGVPSEIAGTAVYLSSDEASYVTGETIVIAGGSISRL